MENSLKKVTIGVDATLLCSAVAMPSHLCLIPTTLCGGARFRLWSVSRELHPKPFIRLADGQSLLQKAYLRGAQLPGVSHLITVTNRELFFKTEDEFREVNATKASTSYILEPFGRNTAPAIAAAALQVAKTHGPDAILLVLAADHLIADQAAFQQAVVEAIELAPQGKLVTFGIQPDAQVQCVGRRRARWHALHTHVKQLGLIGAEADLDIAQGFAPRQLRKGHHTKQVGAAQGAHTRVAAISIDDVAKVLPRHVPHDLRKQCLAHVHAAPSVVQTGKHRKCAN